MLKRILAILLLQVFGFGILSTQIGLASSGSLPPRTPDYLSYDCVQPISVVPVSPTTSDIISITACGIWQNACVPTYQSHQVVSDQIRIDAAANSAPGWVCAEAFTAWGFTITVSSLLAGSYHVDLYITDRSYTQTAELSASKQFLVVDATAPQVVDKSPANGDNNVVAGASAVITFSEPISTSTFNYMVTPNKGGWSANWDGGQQVVTLLHAPFASGTVYTVTVLQAQDLAGNPLAGAPVAWSFRTRYQVFLPTVLKF
jgi:hypothetical protein